MDDLLEKCFDDFDAKISSMEQEVDADVEHKEGKYKTNSKLSHGGNNNWNLKCELYPGISEMEEEIIVHEKVYNNYTDARNNLEEIVKKYRVK